MGAPKKPINKKPAAEDSELDDEDDDLDLKPKKRMMTMMILTDR
jgi:hypothetical protein